MFNDDYLHPSLCTLEEGSITMTSNHTGNHGGYYCSFCGKSQDEVNKIIAGPDVYICDECVGLCEEIIRQDMVGDSEGFSGVSVLKPAEIMAHLNQYVIGQTEAKKSLAVAVYNH